MDTTMTEAELKEAWEAMTEDEKKEMQEELRKHFLVETFVLKGDHWIEDSDGNIIDHDNMTPNQEWEVWEYIHADGDNISFSWEKECHPDSDSLFS